MSQNSAYSLFDIAGPVMVGPSSSHTAGACKIGQYARALFNAKPTKVIFDLHGSFGQVFKGHATDRALLGGVMRFRTSDPAIKDAFHIAEDRQIAYEFRVTDLGAEQHANTVKITMEAPGKQAMSVVGSSIGGGKVEIVQVDDFKVSIQDVAGKYRTLVCLLDDSQEALESLVRIIEKEGVEVKLPCTLPYNGQSLVILRYRGKRIPVDRLSFFEEMKGVYFVRCLNRIYA